MGNDITICNTLQKKEKNDEFYTQYSDIEKEVTAYIEYNPDVFKDKVILLPCDDPEWSNFTKYFAQNFNRFGLKKLISTSYATDSKKYESGYQATLFEKNDPKFDKNKTTKNGKIFTLTHDKTGDGKIDVNDLEWKYLKGSGDFKSEEIKMGRSTYFKAIAEACPIDIILYNVPGRTSKNVEVDTTLRLANDFKNIVGVKFATWRLFQPMGIQWWNGLLDKIDSKSEFYPGYLRETGIGVSYQRMLWKGLFASVEVLPLYKTYLDENNTKIANGFKLYTSYHVGYHIAFGKKKRFFIEPQIHFQNWMFDTNTPTAFKQLDNKWKSYFLFEPNIYVGFRF